MVYRCTNADVMAFGNVSLEHQLCISVFLHYIVMCQSKGVTCIMQRAMHHQCERGVMVGVDGNTVFPLCLIAFSLHPSSI